MRLRQDIMLRLVGILCLTLLGLTVVGFMAYLAYLSFVQGEELGAVGWLTSGFLTTREFMSKIENLSLGIRTGPEEVSDPGQT